jgi:hypothetical protein
MKFLEIESKKTDVLDTLNSSQHPLNRSIHIERDSDTGCQPYILTSRAMQVLARVADTLEIGKYQPINGPAIILGYFT